MLGLFITMAALGLAAVDPVGIAIMPILLLQERPYIRTAAFLGGSFVALFGLGLAFVAGLGAPVLRFEHHATWLVPLVEIVGGVGLLVFAAIMAWRSRAGKTDTAEPSPGVRRWLRLHTWHLFGVGAGLVTMQSIIDVVFVLAMMRLGQEPIVFADKIAAIFTYALAALALQLLVVGIFWAAPAHRKHAVLQAIRRFLDRYATRITIGISGTLGAILLIIAVY